MSHSPRRAFTLVELLVIVVILVAGAYPLMYFAQEYIPLGPAVLISAGCALLIITVRAVTLMGFRLALAGVALPAATILALTVVAAVRPSLQGILLTAEGRGFFIAAMMLLPRIQAEPAVPKLPPATNAPSPAPAEPA